MFKGFRDENAEKMRELAKGILPATERFAGRSDSLAKAGPIVQQFFDQPETNIQTLNTPKLLDAMPGSHHGLVDRFRERMKELYPTIPELWDVPAPVGNMSERYQEKSLASSLGRALELNALAKAALAAAGPR